MRSTFKVLFYTKNQSVKNGKAPIMGRITINGTQAGFSCKKEVSLTLWDVKANRAKGKSEEARTLNQELDNIKAQITKHYQYICDHDSFVTAKKVYNRYVGFADEYHTLMGLFKEQLDSYTHWYNTNLQMLPETLPKWGLDWLKTLYLPCGRQRCRTNTSTRMFFSSHPSMHVLS